MKMVSNGTSDNFNFFFIFYFICYNELMLLLIFFKLLIIKKTILSFHFFLELNFLLLNSSFYT